MSRYAKRLSIELNRFITIIFNSLPFNISLHRTQVPLKQISEYVNTCNYVFDYESFFVTRTKPNRIYNCEKVFLSVLVHLASAIDSCCRKKVSHSMNERWSRRAIKVLYVRKNLLVRNACNHFNRIPRTSVRPAMARPRILYIYSVLDRRRRGLILSMPIIHDGFNGVELQI